MSTFYLQHIHIHISKMVLCTIFRKVTFIDSGTVLAIALTKLSSLRFARIWTLHFDQLLYVWRRSRLDLNMAWNSVNTTAKHCSWIHESDHSTVCTRYTTVFSPRYWLLRVSDLQISKMVIWYLNSSILQTNLTSLKGSDCASHWRPIPCSGWGKHTAGVGGVWCKSLTSCLQTSGLVEDLRKPWMLWRAGELEANNDPMRQDRRIPGECERSWTTSSDDKICRWATRCYKGSE